MSFDKLTQKELVRTAEEDFAFDLSEEEKKSKKLTLAAFVEANLKFSDYLAANPDQKEKFAPTEEKEVKVTERVSKDKINVQEAFEASDEQPYLVKMVRENPLYEVGNYRFTDTHPYALVDSADASKVLSEPGFRLANPDELEEFYG